ncbi:3-phosphoshikimate 1-carboxyvinyltransferase [candidate division KSB1 bacterium]|nr:3-phosphoshikimate 1-carboxyvinyltransferase [candidate division KSB1 bacterium]
MKYKVKKTKGICAEIIVPGDKSISHRAVMFGSLANGTTEISGISMGQDVKSTIKCLKELGITAEMVDGIMKVTGFGLRGLREPRNVLDAGNSGTTIRLMAGILAGQDFSVTLTGDESLSRRPMKRIIEPLQKMGAIIEGTAEGFAPLTIKGTILSSFKHELPVASAQVKSALLLAGMYARGTTAVSEPVKSRDHTERMLSYLGANIGIDENTVTIEGFPLLKAAPIQVPGDISSAAFFIVAATIVPNSTLVIKNIGINPTRGGILEALRIMGADIVEDSFTSKNYEPSTNLQIKSIQLSGTTISREMIPKIIDEIPIFAVAATQAKGETVIRDARELRVKETDRINAVVENLRRMGAAVEELPDGMIIQGEQKLKGAVINSYHDHRIAMAFTIAGLVAEGETIIQNADCVDISYPGFFMQLEELCHA